jgi:hypothetical protein
MVLEIDLVPAVAPCVLGRSMFDFHFKLENQVQDGESEELTSIVHEDAAKGKEKDPNFDQFSG